MKITGNVLNAKTKEPLGGAKITLSVGTTEMASLYSDGKGCFAQEEATDYIGETLTCAAEKEGFETKTLTHMIQEEIIPFEIAMEEEVVPNGPDGPWWQKKLVVAAIAAGVLALVVLGVFVIPSIFRGDGPAGVTHEEARREEARREEARPRREEARRVAVIKKEIDIGPAFGHRNVFGFMVTRPGTIHIKLSWKGAENLALILNGPGQVGFYDRKDGRSPLSIVYKVTPEILRRGRKWKASAINFSKRGSASGNITIKHP